MSKNIAETMKAIVASKPGGPDVLTVATKSVPNMQPDEVLIKVYAAGVNGADLKERQGKYWAWRYLVRLLIQDIFVSVFNQGIRYVRF